ncbi:MAG: carboxyl transferase domain-containing protein [Bacteroidota bacterium]
MKKDKLLIANRGEIALRIIQAAAELGIPTLSIFSEDDANALHLQRSDEAIPLKGRGVAPYLDIQQIIDIATQHEATLIHPGYGFLSENAAFAAACEKARIIFVGPSPAILELLGDKSQARKLAQDQGVPILPGTNEATSLEEAQKFFASLPVGAQMMIKSLSGGGGRGMEIVSRAEEVASASEKCAREALKAVGKSELYVEQYLSVARHVEVQIMGDGKEVSHLWERECSIQRSHQKLIEIAPCPGMPQALREKIIAASVRMAKAIGYEGVGTFEFLLEGNDFKENTPFYFMEANPRIQVEHTVTEEITDIDLVAFQLQQAMGASLSELGLKQDQLPAPKGFSIQMRINSESLSQDGTLKPHIGTLTRFEMPYGKGVRVETAAYTGYVNSPAFDTLLAKLIVHSPREDFQTAVLKAYRNLSASSMEGIGNNISLLSQILKHTAFRENQFSTRFVQEHLGELLVEEGKPADVVQRKGSQGSLDIQEAELPEGTTAIKSPLPGTLISLEVSEGDIIQKGQTLMVVEAMKMETVITADAGGLLKELRVKLGEVIQTGQVLMVLEASEGEEQEWEEDGEQDLDYIRPELQELRNRKAFQLDENREEAVAKRKKKHKQTARENVAQLCDPDSFHEYGSLIVAAQRKRKSEEELIKSTPADGIITGIGTVNGELFEAEKAKCIILCYDYTVLAGTQGYFGHHKTDRVLSVASRSKLPIILFAEGGGGRPGDTDIQAVGGLQLTTFAEYAKHNGVAPRISIVSGYCFAGNAALAGCSDVIIATEDTNLGMGGPAMIEGGGLGKFHPKEVGPVQVQAPNGVIDILVKDEKEAIEVAKKYLTYFQGEVKEWESEDQRKLRYAVPENRRRVYDIRKLIMLLADKDSVLELRKDYAIGMLTAFIRIEGKPMGLIANNPAHLGGAIDAEGAGKAARFIQLCDTFGIPMMSLCDTPGFMVGPEAEKTGLVRHTSRLFTAMAKKQVPLFTVILRKAYGLGSMAMAGGGMHESLFSVSWPTGEFGGMGLEGAVRLGFRKELESVKDPEQREALFQQMVAMAYQHGKAINTAAFLEIDEVIDPLETRKWIVNGLKAIGEIKPNGRGFVDTF